MRDCPTRTAISSTLAPSRTSRSKLASWQERRQPRSYLPAALGARPGGWERTCVARSYDHRLLEVLKSLDAKERAIYWLRAWREGEEPPQELPWVHADDRLEYDMLLDRIQDAHNHTRSQQVIMRNWLAEDESQVYWFASLEAAEERERIAPAQRGRSSSSGSVYHV
jgi:hypothetical protein